MSFQKLDELGRRLSALEHALAILGADEATHMAVGGGEARAEAMSVLAGMLHRQASDPQIADWMEAAEAEDLSEEQKAAVREFRRQYVNLTCLPAEFVERQTRTRMRCEQLWRDLRAKNDWAGFQPALEGVIELAREEAQRRAEVLEARSLRRDDGAVRPGHARCPGCAHLRRTESLPRRFRAEGARGAGEEADEASAQAAPGQLSS